MDVYQPSKTQYGQVICIGTLYQLSKVSYWKIQLGDVDLSNEAMCLEVLLDSPSAQCF